MTDKKREPQSERFTSNPFGGGDCSEPDTQEVTEQEDTERDRESAPKEIGGRKGLDPARYGDWEKQGRCIDF